MDDLLSPPPCPTTVTIRRNPPRRARPTPSATTVPPSVTSDFNEIPSFPINDILSIEVKDHPETKSPASETLKVFLRIKPFLKNPSTKIGDLNARSRSKNVWPQIPKKTTSNTLAKKKSCEACVTVNDCHSVTLTPPPGLLESKRTKSEIYEGFSYVFPPDSSQNEVYEKMVNPLVEDFLNGKSGMLATLGSSGSGKTHTVFGKPRDPGMVPLALKSIFKQTGVSSRLFYISIFEIYSEGGKGEKVSDLLRDGSDLSMQQSTIKGLQEVIIRDAAQAEAEIARAMLKRATAMTGSNSQSSRSQCIINIRAANEGCEGNSSVLTIADLAGAEREKRTGNQGARLLESNFINNTSMVFSLCLRSLLEHQKKPKKALQKHFQNSMLTRYLRDYLEGKKKMTLILTVKAGEDDYLDTSYLLKQASPFMKIKFENINEVSKKRQITYPVAEQNKKSKCSVPDSPVIFPVAEQNKKSKCIVSNTPVIEEIKGGDKRQEPRKDCLNESSRTHKSDVNNNPSNSSADWNKSNRIHHFMQNFAKATWKVLKEYKAKVEVAENEIQTLRENLSNAQMKTLGLEEELNEHKSRCICSKQNIEEIFTAEPDSSFGVTRQPEGHACGVDEKNMDTYSVDVTRSACCTFPEGCDLNPAYVNPQTNVDSHSVDAPDANSFDATDANSVHATESESNDPCEGCNSPPLQNKDESLQVAENKCLSLGEFFCNEQGKCTDLELESNKLSHLSCSNQYSPEASSVGECANFEVCKQLKGHNDSVEKTHKGPEDFSGSRNCVKDSDDLKDLGQKDDSLKPDLPDVARSSQPSAIVGSDNCSSLELPQKASEKIEASHLLPKEVAPAQACHDYVPDSPQKPSNVKKPKRRLLPASSILLVRNMNALYIEDESEIPKVNRSVKKSVVKEKQRSQGSVSLVHLLKRNIRF